MQPASTSIKVFGIYVALTGIGPVFAPGLVLSPLGIPVPTEICNDPEESAQVGALL